MAGCPVRLLLAYPEASQQVVDEARAYAGRFWLDSGSVLTLLSGDGEREGEDAECEGKGEKKTVETAANLHPSRCRLACSASLTSTPFASRVHLQRSAFLPPSPIYAGYAHLHTLPTGLLALCRAALARSDLPQPS